ncbi:MAG: ABC transporter substrate-binding protein [Thermomicrobiales bacterium]
MSAFRTVRMDRRALAASLGAGALVAPQFLKSSPTFAAQESDRALITIANETEPAALDPWLRGYGQTLVTRQIFEPLVDVRMTLVEGSESEVDIEYVPMLAESFEQMDDLTWRFVLRQGVTFHNGEAFDAAALKAAYDVLADPEVAAAAGASALLGVTSGLTVVDDFTVEITTLAPNVELIGQYLRIGLMALPPQLLAEAGIESFAENPVGTGPYMFGSWTKGQKVMLTKFDGYWNAANVSLFDAVEIVSRPEASVRAQSVTSGETDFAYNIGSEQASALSLSTIGGGFQSTSIRINNAIAPTNDVNLRLAINHAIDRQGICDSIFLGSAKPAAFFGFQPVTLEPYPFDPEMARKLVSEAGLEGTELELVYGEGRIPEEDQLAEIYKAFLEDIGLAITLTKVEPLQYNEIGGQAFADQPPLYMETTSSGNYGEIAGGLTDKYGTDGTGTFSDPAFDARFAELSALSGDERNRALQAIAEELHAIAPRAWVAVVQQVHGVSEKLTPALPLNVFIYLTDLVA